MYRQNKRTISSPEEGYITPFAIADGLYFVGTYQASSHLIDTGDGLILIDTGYASTASMVLDSIHALGFDPKDIRYIIHTHHHGDHVDATPEIVRASGAKTIISVPDFPILKQHHFTADLTIEDGGVLTLGDVTIRFILTPGHTVGTISLFFERTYKGKTYCVGTFGGAGVNTLVPESRDYYPGCRRDYLASIAKLEKEQVDIFIGNHVWNNNTEERGKRLLALGENDFINSQEWGIFLDSCRARCQALPPIT